MFLKKKIIFNTLRTLRLLNCPSPLICSKKEDMRKDTGVERSETGDWRQEKGHMRQEMGDRRRETEDRRGVL